MLLSEARERDLVGNTVPAEMAQAELRLEELSEGTIRQAESMGWSGDMGWLLEGRTFGCEA
jgi:hypothetical protein